MFVSCSGDSIRLCRRCGKAKPAGDFSWHRRAKGQLDTLCRSCHAAYGRAHYQANRQRYIDQALARKERVARERQGLIVAFLREHPCSDCGESDPLVLEFDHLADKRFTIGDGITARSWQAILDEIAKCEVVCANCHRRRTATRHRSHRFTILEGESS